MRRIKKYPNGRLYDTIERKYLSRDLLSELVREGAEVLVFDTSTGEDVTSEIIGKFRKENETGSDNGSGSLIHRIGKSSDAVTGRIGKIFSRFRNTITGKDESEDTDAVGNVRRWVTTFPEEFRRRIANTIDRRLDTVFGAINLATKDQVADLADRIAALDEKIDQLEHCRTETAHHEMPESYAAFPESSVEKRLYA